ncbi:MAG TPA: two-component sensor histidine kinase, partial [Caulobacteraceae bacterium]|nr:two-component sensor histidine kinase [Caulobacteraceae bacterium]
MSALDLMLAAAAGAVCLAICATLWALVGRRVGEARLAVMNERLAAAHRAAAAMHASAEAFDTALVSIEDHAVNLVAGEDSLAACAGVLGIPDATPGAVVEALARIDPGHARRLEGLFTRGEA